MAATSFGTHTAWTCRRYLGALGFAANAEHVVNIDLKVEEQVLQHADAHVASNVDTVVSISLTNRNGTMSGKLYLVALVWTLIFLMTKMELLLPLCVVTANELKQVVKHSVPG